METQPREKVGVIVIHGVGETTEGWIDSYLVPQLETYSAYKRVNALDRRPKTNDLLLVARTDDEKFIAIGLEDDNDFRNFCKAFLVAEKADNPLYKTAAARKVNRDALWSEARRVLVEERADHRLRELEFEGIPSCIAFDPPSEVHRVRDPESSTSTSTWASFTRRCRLDDRELVVSELYWADMSKIGYTNVSRSSAIVQLFLESPFVLGETLLKGCDRGVHRVIAALIFTSNWLMRWPIAGLTLPVFLTAFAFLAIQQVFPHERTPAVVAAILGVISVVAFAFFKQTAHRKVGLADLSLSTALFAFLLIVAIGGFAFAGQDKVLSNPENYLVNGFFLLMGAWTLWTLVIVPAAGLVTAVALKRLVLPGARKPPLARSSLAISLNLLLGMVWKLLLPLIGVLAINTLVVSGMSTPTAMKGRAALDSGDACRNFGPINPWNILQAPVDCQLAWVKKFLVTVSLLNAGAIMAVVAVAVLLIMLRGSIARVFKERAKAGRVSLPRLITSPWIVAALFAVSVFNAIFAFTPDAHLKLPAGLDGTMGVGASVLCLIAIYMLAQKLIEMSNSYVHIGRDLVDHQYGASYRPLTAWLLPPPPGEAEIDDKGFKSYRRRRRIQRRLEALIDEVIAHQKMDRLIFLAHSQGTVIMHDYLANHDNLVAKTHESRLSLEGVQRIDLVTVGSPLTHLYRYYFSDYELPAGAAASAPTMMSEVSSWTNMWRIDDPIGQHVDFIEGIENQALDPGGHMDYWSEAAVCARVWELVCDQPKPPSLVHAGRGAIQRGPG